MMVETHLWRSSGILVFAYTLMISTALALPDCSLKSSEITGTSRADGSTSKENMRLDAVDADGASAAFTDCVCDPNTRKILCDGPSQSFKVDDAGVRGQLQQFVPGDHLRLDINPAPDATGKFSLKGVRGIEYYPGGSNPEEEISPASRLLALAISALALYGLAFAVTKGAPNRFIVGQDNRYSNSKVQLAVWFWIVISTYLATFALRIHYGGWEFLGGIRIPQNLFLLSGLSALTYGGAKAITTAKANAADALAGNAIKDATIAAAVCDAAAGTPEEPVAKAKMNLAKVAAVAASGIASMKKPDMAVQPSIVDDLVKNDVGGFDFGDFQMLVVTLIAVGTYLMLIFHFLHTVEFRRTVTLPDVDTTVLALFGIGQGAYLTKKAGGDLGKS